MANSDNVIRAGLTPKLRDVPNLVSTLTYTPAPPSEHVVEPVQFPNSKQLQYVQFFCVIMSDATADLVVFQDWK